MSKISNAGSFRVADNKLLLIRLGPVSGQVQAHRSRNTAPCRRGVWAFPYPFHDAFFYYHRWEKLLPKRLNPPRPTDDAPDEKWDIWHEAMEAVGDEREARLSAIKRENPPSTFWHGGKFYSRIKPRVQDADRDWYRYDNVREWIEAARGHLWCWDGWETGDGRRSVHRATYSVDHLELFLPM